jgi:hypothetical protein
MRTRELVVDAFLTSLRFPGERSYRSRETAPQDPIKIRGRPRAVQHVQESS